MKAIIFDKDGVLVETFNLYFEAYSKSLSEIGVKIRKNDVGKRFGMKGPEIIKQITKENGINITDEIGKKLAKKKDEIYIKTAERKLKLLPGVKKLLVYLKNKKYKIGIASSATRESIEQTMRVTKIKNFIDVTVNGYEVKLGKPHPEIFLKCAKKLKVKPGDCIVIEDSIHGVKAAKEANMECIAVATGQHSKRKLKSYRPDLVLSSLEEFEKILNFLNNSS